MRCAFPFTAHTNTRVHKNFNTRHIVAIPFQTAQHALTQKGNMSHGPDVPSQTSKFTLPPWRENVAVASGYALYLRRAGSWVLILHRAISFLSNFRHVFPWPFARFFRQHGHTSVAMDWMIVVIGIYNNNT